jgi:hypothetical protein
MVKPVDRWRRSARRRVVHRCYLARADVLALYRFRYRIALAFRRLKSIVGLNGPPGTDERSARPYVLANLLMVMSLVPQIDALEDSPHWPIAA